MMTADEKNHVISNANDELDRQILRLDSIFPFIAGEISDEARLGSLTHWAYSNKETAKPAANERPRREAASHKQDLAHALHEAESTRGDTRRDANLARRNRRAHADSDFDEVRNAGSRKSGAANKSRAAGGEQTMTEHTGGSAAGALSTATAAATKRRKVERPPTADYAGAEMERSTSMAGPGGGRTTTKEMAGAEGAKKRSRAPNTGSTATRKRYLTCLKDFPPKLLAQSDMYAGTMAVIRQLIRPSCRLHLWPGPPAAAETAAAALGRLPALGRMRPLDLHPNVLSRAQFRQPMVAPDPPHRPLLDSHLLQTRLPAQARQ